MIIVAIFGVVLLAVVVSYLIFGERQGATRGIVSRVKRCIPLQTVKIVIVVWQILTQVRFPNYHTLDGSIYSKLLPVQYMAAKYVH